MVRYQRYFYLYIYFLILLKSNTSKLLNYSFLFKNFNVSLLMNNSLNWVNQGISLGLLLGKITYIDSIKKKNSKYDTVLRINIFSNKKLFFFNNKLFFFLLDKISHTILSSLDYFDQLEYQKSFSDNKFFFKIPDCSVNKEVNNIILKNNKLKDYFLYSPFITSIDLITKFDNDIAVSLFQIFQFPLVKKESGEFVYTWKKNLDTYYEMKKKGLLITL